MSGNPFAVLGLEPRAGLSDEDVRAAWRRIAAATHPDREDGGDPARYSAAAAAYEELRTSYGRGEALAGPAERRAGNAAGWWRGPEARLAAHAVGAAGLSAGAFAVAGWSPGTAGVLAGALTWVALAAARSRGRDGG